MKAPKISVFGGSNKQKSLHNQGIIYQTFKALFDKVQEQQDKVKFEK